MGISSGMGPQRKGTKAKRAAATQAGGDQCESRRKALRRPPRRVDSGTKGIAANELHRVQILSVERCCSPFPPLFRQVERPTLPLRPLSFHDDTHNVLPVELRG